LIETVWPMLRFTRFGLSGRIHQRKVKKQPSASLLASVTPEGGRDGPIDGRANAEASG